MKRCNGGLWLAAITGGLSALPLQAEEEPALVRVSYCHTVAEDSSPKDRAESFYPDQTIYLSVELKGRLKSGVVGAGFYFQDQLIAEANVDLAESSRGSSSGANTFAAFHFKPQGPLPLGASYRTEVSFDGQALGSYPFRVIPPRDAIVSRVKSHTLVKHTDAAKHGSETVREYGPQDRVDLVGMADLGADSWLEAEWRIHGTLDSSGTRTLTVAENKANEPFAFSFVPNGGWPEGQHEVVLIMNGHEVDREKFSVHPSAEKVAPLPGTRKTVLPFK